MHYFKVLNFFKLGKYENAIETFDKMIQINPNNAKIIYNKGYPLLQLKRYQEAIDCYDKAIELDSNLSNAYLAKGICLDGMDRFDESTDCYKKVIEIDPRLKYNAYYNMMLKTFIKLSRAWFRYW